MTAPRITSYTVDVLMPDGSARTVAGGEGWISCASSHVPLSDGYRLDVAIRPPAQKTEGPAGE